MDAFVALAPSALGVDGAALVALQVKEERARVAAATRVQAAWRGFSTKMGFYAVGIDWRANLPALSELRVWPNVGRAWRCVCST